MRGLVSYGPNDVAAILTDANNAVAAATIAVANSGLPAAERAGWERVALEWIAFRDANKGWRGLPNKLRDNTAARALKFRALADAMAARAAKAPKGGKAAGKAPAPGKGTTITLAPSGRFAPSVAPRFEIGWRGLAVVGGLAVGGYFLYRYYQRRKALAAPGMIPVREEASGAPAGYLSPAAGAALAGG